MKKKILVIDDDKNQLILMKLHLQKTGHEVLYLEDSAQVMEKINSFQPDVLIVDLMMPGVDGFTIIKDVRGKNEFSAMKIIVMSAKSFDFDKNRAYELGANEYIMKPIKAEKLIECLERVISDKTKITFWGTRGTVPTPGNDTLKFGGNTSCVSVELSGERLFIFDTGTGIIKLGKYIASMKKRYKMNIFISHPHWDHIQGLPFFIPAYMKGNEIAIQGSPHGDLSMREVICGQMDSIYFPVTIIEFASRIYFKDLMEGEYKIEGISISSILLNHPGNALGYKLTDSNGKSIAYITDNELVPGSMGNQDVHFREKLVNFLNKVDILIHDSTYFDDEYKGKVGWGHPPITEVLKLAIDAEVKNLYLFHHDPDHNDDKVAEKEAFARQFFKKRKMNIHCSAAVEASSIYL